MRQFALLFSLMILALGHGCKQKTDEQRPIWCDGQTVTADVFASKTMAAMLWIRPSGNTENKFPADYQVYKRFDDGDYEIFLEYLRSPERQSVVEGVSWNEFLFLSFLDGTNYLIGFSISSETVILPNGYSEELYKLFSGRSIATGYDPDKDWGLTLAPNLRAPSPEHRYRDDWIDANVMEGAQKRQNHD